MTTELHATPTVTPDRSALNPLRWSQRTGALVSATALTVMVFLSIFGYFIAVRGLTTPDDAAAPVATARIASTGTMPVIATRT